MFFKMATANTITSHETLSKFCVASESNFRITTKRISDCLFKIEGAARLYETLTYHFLLSEHGVVIILLAEFVHEFHSAQQEKTFPGDSQNDHTHS